MSKDIERFDNSLKIGVLFLISTIFSIVALFAIFVVAVSNSKSISNNIFTNQSFTEEIAKKSTEIKSLYEVMREDFLERCSPNSSKSMNEEIISDNNEGNKVINRACERAASEFDEVMTMNAAQIVEFEITGRNLIRMHNALKEVGGSLEIFYQFFLNVNRKGGLADRADLAKNELRELLEKRNLAERSVENSVLGLSVTAYVVLSIFFILLLSSCAMYFIQRHGRLKALIDVTESIPGADPQDVERLMKEIVGKDPATPLQIARFIVDALKTLKS